MSAYTEHDVAANGIQIHYYRADQSVDKPAIVMIHGLTDNGMCWVRVADALSDRYNIILPDTRGHGLSSKPASGYSVEARAADVAGLIDALKLDRPILFGHSLGGQVANAIAGLYPDKVGALVLEDPAWFASDEPQAQREKQAEDWCAGLRRDKAAGREGLIARARTENPAWHPDELGPWADSKLQMSEIALYEILVSMRPGWQALLREVRCPVLLVTGDPSCGIIITPEMVKEAQTLNPRVQEANIPLAAHCIHRDQFEPYMTKVKAFLAQIR